MKKIFIPAAVLLIAVTLYFAMQFGDLQPVTFSQALAKAEHKSESDITGNVLVVGEVLNTEEFPLRKDGKILSFFMRDNDKKIFRISYDGQEEHSIKAGERIGVTGHAHGGSDAYFHGKQIFYGY